MKYTSPIVLTVFGLSLSAAAQIDTSNTYLKPRKGNIGITLNLTGIINNIQPNAPHDPSGNPLIWGRYYVANSHVFTLGLGAQMNSGRKASVDSVGSGQAKYDSTFKQNSLFISPGYEFHILETRRLDPYLGGAIHLGFIGKRRESSVREFVDTTGTDKTNTDYRYAGGFQFGISGVVGFNYFVAKNLSVGVEYRFGLMHTRTGGDFEVVSTNTPVSGNAVSRRIVGSDRNVQTSLIMTNSTAISLSYFFGRKEDRYLPD